MFVTEKATPMQGEEKQGPRGRKSSTDFRGRIFFARIAVGG
jgi:hypothetical protein